MWSDKLTLSLTSLVVLLAFGLICFVPTASAHDDKTKTANEFNVSLIAAESMMDVSYRGDGAGDNIQIMKTAGQGTTITLLAKFDVVVNLADPVDTAQTDDDDVDVEDLGEPAFSVADIAIDAYDSDGRSLGTLTLTEVTDADDLVQLSHRDPNNPGKEFLIRIDEELLSDAYTEARGGGTRLEIATLLISIGEAKVQDASLGEILKFRKGEHFPHSNKRSNVFQIHFVEADAGLAKYESLAATPVAATEGTPGVVSIDRILDRSGFTPIETGPFNVRVILTEEPRMGDKSGLTTDMVMVEGGGSATAVTAGLTYDGGARTVSETVTPSGADNADSELTLAMLGDYHTANATTPDEPTAVTAETALPNATGRDNKYYTYSVTITPNAGVNGDLTISIKQFMDHVKPASRMYLPTTPAQRVATTLVAAASAERYARIANETLTVRVSTAGAPKTDATVAYEARQKVLDAVTNDTELGKKLVVPAGGYLVIHNAAIADTGIVDPGNKVNTKKLDPAKDLYNVTKLTLTFPADDLDNFFRNGGTLNLGYADIPEATGSGHDDAKSPQADKAHADYTGYDGASTNVYGAGALIINEIMWGLDGAGKDSQYIELHNPSTTAAIGIDSKEWVISVGGLPTGYAAIDTVGNNPATGFWPVPGNGGATTASPEYPAIIDLVSMSRVAGGTDGTAEASWAKSERPSANLSGRRIGTPGAANSYVMPAVVTPPVVTTPPVVAPTPVAVATAADIVISEIMYSAGRGNLPQWIELHNMSASEVSLEGWNVEIENDGGSDLTITLGAITVGVGEKGSQGGQAVLLVSKNGRNSGMGDEEGDLRRVVNLKDLGVTGTLLSSTGFTITLSPPPAAGSSVRTDGDVAGGMDWDLPMMDDDRSSLIREKDADGTYKDGSMRMSWHPTSSTGRYGTYYGHPSDMGTPGYVKGGALPVELSMFYPARDKLTGQVVITWETQSELNNAGFYIKRSEQPNGTFVVINPTMIPGAGTTAEKQSYTHTDTTAKPNVLYYYQIEDVSLDGKRATLTGAHRLRGHIGAAGKVTTIWGELKAQE